MKKSLLISVLGLILFSFLRWDALAQMPNPYGLPINLEAAKKIAASAIAEARKNNWSMAVAITRHRRGPRLLREDGWHPDRQRQGGDR